MTYKLTQTEIDQAYRDMIARKATIEEVSDPTIKKVLRRMEAGQISHAIVKNMTPQPGSLIFESSPSVAASKSLTTDPHILLTGLIIFLISLAFGFFLRGFFL